MPNTAEYIQGECTIVCPAHAVRLFMKKIGSSQLARSQATGADLLPGCRHAPDIEAATVFLMTHNAALASSRDYRPACAQMLTDIKSSQAIVAVLRSSPYLSFQDTSDCAWLH